MHFFICFKTEELVHVCVHLAKKNQEKTAKDDVRAQIWSQVGERRQIEPNLDYPHLVQLHMNSVV